MFNADDEVFIAYPSENAIDGAFVGLEVALDCIKRIEHISSQDTEELIKLSDLISTYLWDMTYTANEGEVDDESINASDYCAG